MESFDGIEFRTTINGSNVRIRITGTAAKKWQLQSQLQIQARARREAERLMKANNAIAGDEWVVTFHSDGATIEHGLT